MTDRPASQQETQGNPPPRRKKIALFCYTCGKTGHNDSDCPQGPESEDISTNSANESLPYSVGDSPARSQLESTPSESASCAESTSPANPSYSNRALGKKNKVTKQVKPEALEALFRTGDGSRNPVGEKFANYSEDLVKVSDESFCDSIKETFEDFGLDPEILKMIQKIPYKTPLPIQKYAWSIINSGKSLKASARTGCGKTAAFLLPVIDNVLKHDARTQKELPQLPQALILSPTRELAQQIYSEASKFAARLDIKICLCHGSATLYDETRKIKAGTNILIGTLGRTVDHLRRKNIALDDLRFLVLDEADRVMDEDFAESIDELMSHINESGNTPQTLMFSATFADRIMGKIDSLFADHVFLQVGILGTVNDDVEQKVLLVEERDKQDTLLDILREESVTKVKTFVFVRSRERAEILGEFLWRNRILVVLLHGERDQFERTKALKQFNDGTRNVMVATLLANRGLDVNLVNHVINYDLPGEIEQYVNCLGRTGRVGNKGRATSFFDPRHRDDRAIAPFLKEKLSDAGLTPPDFLNID